MVTHTFIDATRPRELLLELSGDLVTFDERELIDDGRAVRRDRRCGLHHREKSLNLPEIDDCPVDRVEAAITSTKSSENDQIRHCRSTIVPVMQTRTAFYEVPTLAVPSFFRKRDSLRWPQFANSLNSHRNHESHDHAIATWAIRRGGARRRRCQMPTSRWR